jgi:hypothetical protein
MLTQLLQTYVTTAKPFRMKIKRSALIIEHASVALVSNLSLLLSLLNLVSDRHIPDCPDEGDK